MKATIDLEILDELWDLVVVLDKDQLLTLAAICLIKAKENDTLETKGEG